VSDSEQCINFLSALLAGDNYTNSLNYLQSQNEITLSSLLRRAHWDAILERESLSGNSFAIRRIFDAMTKYEFITNENSYLFLLKSYWKDGTLSDLTNTVKEMIFLGIQPNEAVLKIVSDAHTAASIPEPDFKDAVVWVNDQETISNSKKQKPTQNVQLRKLQGLHVRVQLYFALHPDVVRNYVDPSANNKDLLNYDLIVQKMKAKVDSMDSEALGKERSVRFIWDKIKMRN